MRRVLIALCLLFAARAALPAQQAGPLCDPAAPLPADRNASEPELRCQLGVEGPGRFGLISYADVPVYQPDTPMPGTHMVGIPGQPGPAPNESFEAWEWRMLVSDFGPEADRTHNAIELLDPRMASRILELERRMTASGIRYSRRETWRSPQRQAHLFQRGRSRGSALATATLTSWHCQVDERGAPAARAVDYLVDGGDMRRFHELVRSVGLRSFGADSNDPGHVYLPDEDAVDAALLAHLRVLPRVPFVTLATGRPVDLQPLPGGMRELRDRLSPFLAGLTFRQPRLEPLGRAEPHIVERMLAARQARPAGAGLAPADL